tara:strand:+ start:413 stop:967 length:555 start_codon:yes stop_codon:yes gene_type:complete
MYLLLLLLGSGTTLYYLRNKYDIGDFIMMFIRLYEKINRNLIKPVNKYLESKEDMTEIYKNNKLCSIEEIKDCTIDDTIEILWKGRYRAIYNGGSIDYICPFTEVSNIQHILYANLYKNGEMIDVTKRIEEYCGPKGDFFEPNMIIYNLPSLFYDSNRNRMLENEDDHILVMDNRGNEAKLKLN